MKSSYTVRELFSPIFTVFKVIMFTFKVFPATFTVNGFALMLFNFINLKKVQLGWVKPAPCIRIGVQEDNFVFDHFLQFYQFEKSAVRLG